MAVFAAILLLFGGVAGLLGSWNAARPLLDPTRRYSPRWLPAMVVTELAPFWLLVQVVVLVSGLAFGGWDNCTPRLQASTISTRPQPTISRQARLR